MKKFIKWIRFQWFMFYEVELSGFTTYNEWKNHQDWMNDMAKEAAELLVKLKEK